MAESTHHPSQLIENPALVDTPTTNTAAQDSASGATSHQMQDAATEALAHHTAELARLAAANAPAPAIVPVQVTVAPLNPDAKRIVLVAVDTSDASRYALQYAIQTFAKEHVVLNVVTCFAAEVGSLMPENVQSKQLAVQVTDQEMMFAEWVSSVFDEEQSILPYHVSVAIGDPVTEINRLAVSLNAKLVVVGSTGKGTIRKALLGSVSETLTRTCKRPVLVVRTPPSQASESTTATATTAEQQ